jgi:hypothetical protein
MFVSYCAQHIECVGKQASGRKAGSKGIASRGQHGENDWAFQSRARLNRVGNTKRQKVHLTGLIFFMCPGLTPRSKDQSKPSDGGRTFYHHFVRVVGIEC